MLKLKKTVTFLFIFSSVVTHSQNSLSDNEKNAVINRIKVLIDSKYVFVDEEIYNNSLDSIIKTIKFKGINQYKDFADFLTYNLIKITKDKSLKIQYNPRLVTTDKLTKQLLILILKKLEVRDIKINFYTFYSLK